MPIDDCTPKNAMGKLAGVMDAGGIETTEGAINLLDDNAKMLYHQIRSQSGSQSLTAAKPELSDKVDDLLSKTTESLTDESGFTIRGGLTQGLKPTDFMPEEITAPILDYVDAFAAKHHGNFGAGRVEYLKGMRRVIKDLGLDNHPDWLQGEARHWLRDLSEGYPFYTKSGNVLTKGVNNMIANAIDFSGNILFGNIPEIMIKMPTVYGITGTGKGAIEALKATKGNLWGKIPELEARGYYGFEKPKGKIPVVSSTLRFYENAADGVMALTDRPLKNLAYGAGLAKTGNVMGGIEGIEKIAFKNRLGNDSRITRNAFGRGSLTFMNYTLSTYHLIGGNVVGLFTKGKQVESARQLATYFAMTGLVGGGTAALIPEPFSYIFNQVDSGFKEWEKENIGPLGKLVRPGSLTSLGISTQMTQRAWQRAGKKLGDAGKALSDGDLQGASLDIADVGMSLSGMIRNPFGNPRVQKVLRSTRELFEGDISGDEYSTDVRDALLPFLKEAK